MDKHTFGHRLVEANDRAFKSIKRHLQRSNYRNSILALLQIPLGLPYIFFNSPEGTSVKIDISPTQTSQPTQVKIGSSQVFTIDGTVSNARIKIKLRIRAPTGGEEVKTSVCEMDKEYFSAKFIVDFLEAGDYDFILEYSLIDREGTQWSTKNAKEFKYTASNKRRY